MAVLIPEIENTETAKLTAKVTELMARGATITEDAKVAHALAVADRSYADKYQSLVAQGRDVTDELGATQRRLNEMRQTRRENAAREITGSAQYHEVLIEAIAERAECLRSQGALFLVHLDATRRGITLKPALPPEVGRDVDMVLHWAREVIRVGIVKTADLPKGWLRSALEAER